MITLCKLHHPAAKEQDLLFTCSQLRKMGNKLRDQSVRSHVNLEDYIDFNFLWCVG